MKNKAPLVLMEQLVMVLVFALAAVICLGLFAKAGEVSEESRHRDEAVALAQSAAELLKDCGDPQEVAAKLDTGEYTLEIQMEQTTIPNFAQAEIRILRDETLLFTLRTGWQEAGG